MGYPAAFSRMLDSAVFALPFFLVFALGRLLWYRKRNRKGYVNRGGNEAALYSFVFYLLMLFGITVFRRAEFDFSAFRSMAARLDTINLVPFDETLKLYKNGAINTFIINAVGNLLWFVPFGLLFPTLYPGPSRVWVTLALSLAISFSIEAMQFVFGAGICDVDDLMINVLGAAVGCLIYYLAKRPKRR